MFKKLILLSNLIILMSIVPARAQYSFTSLLGGSLNDVPKGIFELKNGSYIVYGSWWSGTASGTNYIACIDKFGRLLWDKIGTSKYHETSFDGFETNDGDIIILGMSAISEGSATMTKLRPDGSIVLDTTFMLNKGAGESGFIIKSFHDDEKQEIVSIGWGGKFTTPYVFFIKTSYLGKRLWYRYINPPSQQFLLQGFFKIKGRNEYLAFTDQLVMRLDSMGHQIGPAQSVLEENEGNILRITDICQNGDGTFTSIGNKDDESPYGYYLRKHNVDGLFENYIANLGRMDTVTLLKLSVTKDKGWNVAGKQFFSVDSTGKIISQNKADFVKDKTYLVSIKTAMDGGIYGCSQEFSSNNGDNIYIFKTMQNGEISTGLVAVDRHSLKASVMPNPSTGKLSVTGEFKDATVTICNQLGQNLVRHQHINSGENVDATFLEAGIYILTIDDRNKTYVQKVNIIK